MNNSCNDIFKKQIPKSRFKTFGAYTLDWKASVLREGDRIVQLSRTQFRALALLVQAYGKVVPKEKFHSEIWRDIYVEDGSLTQTVFLLRKALGHLPDGSEYIQTIPKKGYRLAPAALRVAQAQPAENVGSNHGFGLSGDEPYRLLVESIEDYAIYMLDCAGRVCASNRGAEQNEGFSGRDVLGHHYSLFFVAEDIEARIPDREVSIAAATGHCTGEGWRLKKNGQRFWASFTLTALRNADGKLLGYAKVMRDRTDSKRQDDALLAMEATVRRERARLSAVAESSMDALYICEAVKDRNGEIEDFVFTYLNRNVEKMIAISHDQLVGRRMCELLPVNRDMGLFDAYKQVALTGEPFITEFPVQGKKTTCQWIRVQAVRCEEGVAITEADITNRKQAQAILLQLAHRNAQTTMDDRSVRTESLFQALGELDTAEGQ